MKFRPIALCATRASPGPGSPTGTSSHCRTSGPPVLWKRIAWDMSGTSWKDPDCKPRLLPAGPVLPEDVGDEALEHRSDALQLAAVHAGQLREHLAAAARPLALHLAPVGARRLAGDQPLAHQPVDQAHGAVVLDEELAREVVDGDALALAGPEDQHRLVVLGGKSCLRRRLLAEAQELPHRPAEGGQARVVPGAQPVAPLGLLQEQGFSLIARRRQRRNIALGYDRDTIYLPAHENEEDSMA